MKPLAKLRKKKIFFLFFRLPQTFVLCCEKPIKRKIIEKRNTTSSPPPPLSRSQQGAEFWNFKLKRACMCLVKEKNGFVMLCSNLCLYPLSPCVCARTRLRLLNRHVNERGWLKIIPWFSRRKRAKLRRRSPKCLFSFRPPSNSAAVRPASSLAPLHFALMQINAITTTNSNLLFCFFRFGLCLRRCDEDVNECEQRGCGDGGECVNTLGSFYCNCSGGYDGQFCDERTSDDGDDDGDDDDYDAQVEWKPAFDTSMSWNAFTFSVWGRGSVFLHSQLTPNGTWHTQWSC